MKKSGTYTIPNRRRTEWPRRKDKGCKRKHEQSQLITRKKEKGDETTGHGVFLMGKSSKLFRWKSTSGLQKGNKSLLLLPLPLVNSLLSYYQASSSHTARSQPSTSWQRAKQKSNKAGKRSGWKGRLPDLVLWYEGKQRRDIGEGDLENALNPRLASGRVLCPLLSFLWSQRI